MMQPGMRVEANEGPDGKGPGDHTFMVTLGSEKFKVVGEKELEIFRNAAESGKTLEEIIYELHRNSEYQDMDLPDEKFLSYLDKQENIDILMQGETRPEVYILVRASESQEAGDSKKPGFKRVLLKMENGHYVMKRNEAIKHQDSARILPNDKLILRRREANNA